MAPNVLLNGTSNLVPSARTGKGSRSGETPPRGFPAFQVYPKSFVNTVLVARENPDWSGP